MNLNIKTRCPYCGHENISLVAMTSKQETLRFLVSCDDAGDGGCDGEYAAHVQTKVELGTPSICEVVGEREYLERHGLLSAASGDEQ